MGSATFRTAICAFVGLPYLVAPRQSYDYAQSDTFGRFFRTHLADLATSRTTFTRRHMALNRTTVREALHGVGRSTTWEL